MRREGLSGSGDGREVGLEGGSGLLTRDIPFSSPSTAAAVALGRSSNGRLEWKSADGGTYGDWENRGVE